ncbi:sensor histidine kinase [Paenibacillus koleovorans]|uniref:sensor histidine kinase n=1 Tax=Paenibacillus koleovorans TaxID=121608 RepID=UPI000FD6B963|nr:sensor histidine kinase [Paenibacillus koleovorans]
MKRSLKKMSLFQRLILYFTIIIFFSLSLVSYIIYRHSTTQMFNQAEDYLNHIVRNTLAQTDRFIDEYELTSLALLANNHVKAMLDLNRTEMVDLGSYNEITHIINQMSLQHHEIELIMLIGENGKIAMSNRPYLETLVIPNIYRDVLNSTPNTGRAVIDINPSLTLRDQYVISISRQLRGRFGFEPKGILRIDVRASALEELWDVANFSQHTFFIMNDQGRIIYHPDKQMIGTELNNSTIWTHLQNQSDGTFVEAFNKEQTLFHFNTSNFTGWKILATTPYSLILEPASVIKKTTLGIGMSALLISMMLALLFTRSISRPLAKIQRGMRRVDLEQWSKISLSSSIEEIDSFVKNYNAMVDRLSTLLEQLYKSELKTKQTELERQQLELQALQYQINPHFLHNTLGTINSYAILKEADDISEMTEALSNMFRYSIRNMEIVALSDELNHIENYLFIHEHRFQKKPPIEYHIPALLMDREMVKLSLQPLVENALQHGIRNRPHAKIIISAHLDTHYLCITVEDNGAGIPAPKLAEIQASLKETESGFSKTLGIGIQNVHRRIQIIFGPEYGVVVESEEDRGTKMTMQLPSDISRTIRDLPRTDLL